MSSTLLSLNCVSQVDFRFKSVKSSFFEEEKKRKKVKKKRTALLKTFAKKRTALFEDSFAEDRLHKKYKIVSLSHREHTKHEYTFLVYSFASSLLKSFRFAAAAIE